MAKCINIQSVQQDKDRDALNQQMDELMKQFDSKSSILVQPTPGLYNIAL